MDLHISIAITTHNRLDDLRHTLDQIGRYEGQYHELIVCADGCCDGTQQYLKDNYPEIQLIENNPGEGSIPSRNRMIRMAKTPYVLLLDDDSYPIDEHFFDEAQQVMERHPEIGVLTFPQRSEEFPETLAQQDFGPNLRVGTFTSSGSIIRTSLFEELGGFPDFFFHAYEEPDYSLRVHTRGFQIVQWCQLTIRHHFTQAMRNEVRTHHRHARNEMWSTIMRAPFPLVLCLIPYRVFSQARYAFRRGVSWLVNEPVWWWSAVISIPKVFRSREPTPKSFFNQWIDLQRNPQLFRGNFQSKKFKR